MSISAILAERTVVSPQRPAATLASMAVPSRGKMPPEPPGMPVTERTRHRRLRAQGSTDRRDLDAVLAAGVICHLGVIIDGYPMVIPTVYGVAGDTLYLHGSVASRSLETAPDATGCVTVTHV